MFRDPASLDGKQVHLHLEHRVVQRLLGRFLAQGFVHDDLSRGCVVLTDEPTPTVIVLGRLSLYGEGASRLHDQVLVAAAEWVEPELRTGRLRPLNEADRLLTVARLEESLLQARSVPDGIRKRLTAIAPRDVEELTPHLQRRGETLARAALRDLEQRGEREAQEMTTLLSGQRKRIEETLKEWRKTEGAQQLSFWKEEEKQQPASDRRHQERRLSGIEEELNKEPQRIRQTYRLKAQRVEPVGILYLWPRTG